jgi:tRNA-uridine 2-sulfurtransferase
MPMPIHRHKVLVAMSGGVDSSVVAALLARDYDVVGLHITKHDISDLSDEIRLRDEECLKSAQRSAEVAGVPLITIEAGRDFDRLIDRFCEAYNNGETPNPCVRCNVTIKWRILLETADREGTAFVATGHYARIEKRGRGFHLLRGKGGDKDQTYFLHRLTQRELSRTLFPLADFAKSDVKALAREMGIPAVERAESQEICFVGAAGYREIIERRTPGAVRPGDVVDTEGRLLGRHEGFQFYTVGQRKGLKIALGHPAYVVNIDAARARVTLGPAEALLSRRFRVRDVNWISGAAPDRPFTALVRIRYNHRGAPALVTPSGDSAIVGFTDPVKSITPGQAAVFYQNDDVLGGGWIARDAENT